MFAFHFCVDGKHLEMELFENDDITIIIIHFIYMTKFFSIFFLF